MNDSYTFCVLSTEVVRGGSRRFDAMEPLPTRVQVSYTHLVPLVNMVQEGSRRFDAVEPLRTRVQVSYIPRSPSE